MPRTLLLLVARRLAVLLPVAFAAATTAPAGDAMADRSDAAATFLDFDRLERPGSPNHWLIAPAGGTPQPRTDVQEAVFDVAPTRLAEGWLGVVKGQPRTTILAVADDGLQIEAEQRSAVFGFVDRISFRAIPLAERQSTYTAYSRSLVGYWDVGVNQGRLGRWAAALRQAVAVDPSR